MVIYSISVNRNELARRLKEFNMIDWHTTAAAEMLIPQIEVESARYLWSHGYDASGRLAGEIKVSRKIRNVDISEMGSIGENFGVPLVIDCRTDILAKPIRVYPTKEKDLKQ
ncbi:MAG: hypothetical protein HYX24_07645 [Candidatus Aenigmarchaeota archaeon]|nr:hypothetical protein [Candidatus Aenigmarchaeota archaeon]